MKTAMQILIDELSFIEGLKDEIDLSQKSILKTAAIKNLLEKEKEQIINAANQKIFGDITFTGSDEVITKGENYYNQTYNQDRELPKDVTDLLENYKFKAGEHIGNSDYDLMCKFAIEFAKLHVKAALEAATTNRESNIK
jgi:hypothetical protein